MTIQSYLRNNTKSLFEIESEESELDIDKVITQLKEAAVSCNRMAEEYEQGEFVDLETVGFYKGKSEAFRGTALLLANLQLEDTLANLK